MDIYQGENGELFFQGLPARLDEISDLQIVFSLRKRELLRKGISDCTLQDETVILPLTQADTLAFPRGRIDCTMLLLLTNGDRAESGPMPCVIRRTVHPEVLT